MLRSLLLLPALALLVHATAQQTVVITEKFRQIADSAFGAHPEMLGVLLHVESPDRQISWSYAAGNNGTTPGRPLNALQPVLIASNTKTFIAATTLRIIEKGKLAIDQPIRSLVSESSQIVLTTAGYTIDSITIRHLLSHTSGIRDYVDDGYFDFIDKHRQYAWTRAEQIERAGSLGGPLGKPGAVYKYADVNFLLLTEIIEHVTGKPFYTAVRELLDYRKNRLNNTWFIKLEQRPAGSLPPADQYWERFHWEIKELDPSWDLYGGGGIASTTTDLAHFYQLLFTGKIVRDKKVLELMTTDVPPNLEVNYCLGIKKIRVGDAIGYNHGGGLGTDVTYFPAVNATIAVAAIDASKRSIAMEIRNLLLAELRKN